MPLSRALPILCAALLAGPAPGQSIDREDLALTHLVFAVRGLDPADREDFMDHMESDSEGRNVYFHPEFGTYRLVLEEDDDLDLDELIEDVEDYGGDVRLDQASVRFTRGCLLDLDGIGEPAEADAALRAINAIPDVRATMGEDRDEIYVEVDAKPDLVCSVSLAEIFEAVRRTFPDGEVEIDDVTWEAPVVD